MVYNKASKEEMVYWRLSLPDELRYWKEVPYEEMLSYLRFPRAKQAEHYTAIRENAVRALVHYHSIGTLDTHPLQQGAVLAIFGNSSFSRAHLKERLAPLGIRLGRGIRPETTHVLVNPMPRTIEPLQQAEQKVLLSDAQLQTFLDHLEAPYLQQKDYSQQVGHLKDLLMSFKKENILTATTIMKGGGVPEEALYALVLAAAFSENNEVVEIVSQLLKNYLPAEALKLLKKTFQMPIDIGEARLAFLLHDFCHTARLDGIAMARELFHYHKKGFQAIWSYSDQESLDKEIIEQLLEGTTLDLSNRQVSEILADLGACPAIKAIDLSGNYLEEVPTSVFELPHLEELNLSKNRSYEMGRPLKPLFSHKLARVSTLRELTVDAYPTIVSSISLKNMTQLRTLNLVKFPYQQPSAKALDNLYQKLANCKVNIMD